MIEIIARDDLPDLLRRLRDQLATEGIAPDDDDLLAALSPDGRALYFAAFGAFVMTRLDDDGIGDALMDFEVALADLAS